MNISTKHYYLVHYKRIHHNDCRNILLQNEAPKIQNGVGEGHLSESKGVPVLEALNCKQKAKIICSSPPLTPLPLLLQQIMVLILLLITVKCMSSY